MDEAATECGGWTTKAERENYRDPTKKGLSEEGLRKRREGVRRKGRLLKGKGNKNLFAQSRQGNWQLNGGLQRCIDPLKGEGGRKTDRQTWSIGRTSEKGGGGDDLL